MVVTHIVKGVDHALRLAYTHLSSSSGRHSGLLAARRSEKSMQSMHYCKHPIELVLLLEFSTQCLAENFFVLCVAVIMNSPLLVKGMGSPKGLSPNKWQKARTAMR